MRRGVARGGRSRGGGKWCRRTSGERRGRRRMGDVRGGKMRKVRG